MKTFVVKNNIIENIVEADEGFTIDGCDLFPAQGVQGEIGWEWRDGSPIAPVPSQDLLAKNMRIRRDRFLASTDWTQAADAPVDQSAWATYRQALRDVPAQAGFPDTVTWPTKPSGA